MSDPYAPPSPHPEPGGPPPEIPPDGPPPEIEEPIAPFENPGRPIAPDDDRPYDPPPRIQ